LPSRPPLRARCRLSGNRQAGRIVLSDEEVADREQHGEAEERARRQHGGKHPVERQLDSDRIAFAADEKRAAGKQRALTRDLAQRAERDEHEQEPETRREAARGGNEYRPAARDRLRLRENRAVRDDQRNEEPEHLVQLVQERVRQQVDARDERCDDQHEQRDPHDRHERTAHHRDHGVRDDEHGRRRETQGETVDRRRRDREQRAQAEELHERGIARPKAFVQRLSKLVHAVPRLASRASRVRSRPGDESLAYCSSAAALRAAANSSSRWRSKYSSVLRTARTIARGVTVAPVSESNAPPSLSTAQSASGGSPIRLPSNCRIQSDLRSSIASPRPGVSRWLSTRTPVSVPSGDRPTKSRIGAL